MMESHASTGIALGRRRISASLAALVALAGLYRVAPPPPPEDIPEQKERKRIFSCHAQQVHSVPLREGLPSRRSRRRNRHRQLVAV